MKRIWSVIRCCMLGGMLACLSLSGAEAADMSLPAPGAVNGETAHELVNKLSSSLVVLDVRTLEEFSAGHVPGAVHIPVQELEKRIQELPADKPVLIICRTGRRAAAAYETLTRAWPAKKDMWFLQGVPEYLPNGSYVFH